MHATVFRRVKMNINWLFAGAFLPFPPTAGCKVPISDLSFGASSPVCASPSVASASPRPAPRSAPPPRARINGCAHSCRIHMRTMSTARCPPHFPLYRRRLGRTTRSVFVAPQPPLALFLHTYTHLHRAVEGYDRALCTQDLCDRPPLSRGARREARPQTNPLFPSLVRRVCALTRIARSSNHPYNPSSPRLAALHSPVFFVGPR